MCDEIGKVFQLYDLNLHNFLHDEIYASVCQIVDPNDFLRSVDEVHCRALLKSSRKYNYDDLCGMLTVWYASTVNLKRVAYTNAVYYTDGI